MLPHFSPLIPVLLTTHACCGMNCVSLGIVDGAEGMQVSIVQQAKQHLRPTPDSPTERKSNVLKLHCTVPALKAWLRGGLPVAQNFPGPLFD